MRSYIVHCDDADPEAKCFYSAEGTSLDETFQKYLQHTEQYHTERFRALSPEQLKAFQRRVVRILKYGPPRLRRRILARAGRQAQDPR